MSKRLFQHMIRHNILALFSFLLHFWFAINVFNIWDSPNPDDIKTILTCSTVVSAEFFLVIANLFILPAPTKYTVIISALILGMIMIGINSIMPGNTVIYIYLFSVLTRLISAGRFNKEAAITSAMVPIIIYAFLMIVIIIPFRWLIPEMGLNAEFLFNAGYIDLKNAQEISGLFFDLPHLSFAFALGYLILIAIFGLLQSFFISLEMLSKQKKG